MGTRMRLEDRRSHLVDAALEVASTEGIAATTVRRVAEQAGVALGVVHYCFEDKDELFIALASRIVDELSGAGAAALDARGARPPDLAGALHAAITGLWASVEANRGAQLLTYEITTHALRNTELRDVAVRQYSVSQVAAEQFLTQAAEVSGATWTRPVAELAADALAFVDGVTLRWLVDGDGAAARSRLDSFADQLSMHAKTRRRRRRAGTSR